MWHPQFPQLRTASFAASCAGVAGAFPKAGTRGRVGKAQARRDGCAEKGVNVSDLSKGDVDAGHTVGGPETFQPALTCSLGTPRACRAGVSLQVGVGIPRGRGPGRAQM